MRQLLVKNRCATDGLPMHQYTDEEEAVNWKTPKIVEIALGAEINCYACADLK
jgi:coenzyme PQQ precursor peptide PqqA